MAARPSRTSASSSATSTRITAPPAGRAHTQREVTVVGASRLQRAAEAHHALAQAGQPAPAAAVRAGAPASRGLDHDLESGRRCCWSRIRTVLPGACRKRVGQPFLDHPEGAGLGPGRQCVDGRLGHQLDRRGRRSGRPPPAPGSVRGPTLSSTGSPSASRSTCSIRSSSTRASRLASAIAARRPLGGCRVVRDHGLTRLGLDGDQRDRVGDHVVQLAGDPATFGLHRLGGLRRPGERLEPQGLEIALAAPDRRGRARPAGPRTAAGSAGCSRPSRRGRWRPRRRPPCSQDGAGDDVATVAYAANEKAATITASEDADLLG